MLPISLYQLTRIDDLELFAKYEQQLSRRKEITEPKDREVSTLREFVNNILGVAAPVSQIIGSLQHFFFAYQIPKIPKEFDLLRLSDEMIINIELKSESDDQKITKQLKQNRHYLKALCKPIQLYAFRKDNNKLYTLTEDDVLHETSFKILFDELAKNHVLMSFIQPRNTWNP